MENKDGWYKITESGNVEISFILGDGSKDVKKWHDAINKACENGIYMPDENGNLHDINHIKFKAID